MFDKAKDLAERMMAKDSKLRIAFHEADKSSAQEPEADEFLKVNGSRLGRDFKLYSLMAKVGDAQAATVSMLEEMVLPLQKFSPAAFAEGLAFMEEQAPVFGENAGEWKKIVAGFKR